MKLKPHNNLSIYSFLSIHFQSFQFPTTKQVKKMHNSMGDLGRSPIIRKKCEPLDERSYNALTVFYIFLFNFFLFASSLSLLCFPLLSSTSQPHTLYFLQTNYYMQVYQFNLLLISFKLARKTKTLKI
jgi:hypothetical protein